VSATRHLNERWALAAGAVEGSAVPIPKQFTKLSIGFGRLCPRPLLARRQICFKPDHGIKLSKVLRGVIRVLKQREPQLPC
jgi:hypothetical protein